VLPAAPTVAPPAAPPVAPGKPLVESWDDDSTTPQLDEDDLRIASTQMKLAAAAARAPAAPSLKPATEGEIKSSASFIPAPTSGVVPTDADVGRLFEAERHFRRGNRALERERFGEALAAFEQAVALCPSEGEFVAYLAWARHCAAPHDRDANDRAVAELDRAATLAPALFVVSLLRARVLSHAGRTADAREAYARVLALEPSSEEARVALARLALTGPENP
jgi:tetratricopeptide (TPR) repeat protein